MIPPKERKTVPTFKKADQEIAKLARELGGQVVRVGSKPWVYFNGEASAENAKKVANLYKELYGGTPPFAGPSWRKDQPFDYAIRVD
jgi:hypothetical protein